MKACFSICALHALNTALYAGWLPSVWCGDPVKYGERDEEGLGAIHHPAVADRSCLRYKSRRLSTRRWRRRGVVTWCPSGFAALLPGRGALFAPTGASAATPPAGTGLVITIGVMSRRSMIYWYLARERMAVDGQVPLGGRHGNHQLHARKLQ